MIIMKVIVIMLKLTSRLTVVPLAPWLCTAATAVGRNENIIVIIIIIIIIIIILITTRPKSAYSRQGQDWIVGPEYSFRVYQREK